MASLPKQKLCECGCGEPAPIAQRTERSKGRVRGQPQRFLRGHHRRATRERVEGARFGRLLVLREAMPEPKFEQRRVDCVCDCGAQVTVLLGNLRKGTTRSCGCLARELAAFANRNKVPPPIKMRCGFYSPCLIWQGGTGSQGYGQVREGYVHRLIFEAANGPLPEGFDIHHLCRQKACVNLDHLEALPKSEHTRLHMEERAAVCPVP